MLPPLPLARPRPLPPTPWDLAEAAFCLIISSGDMFAIRLPGDVVVHVPKSIQVEEGCPDQGDWLWTPRTGKVQRLGRPSAESSP